MFSDEAFFAGNPQHEGALKQFITERDLLYEQKGYTPFSGRNLLHLIMASNSDYVVPVSADERRFFILDVVAKEYFGTSGNELTGRAANDANREYFNALGKTCSI